MNFNVQSHFLKIYSSADLKRHITVILSLGLLCLLFMQFEIEKSLGLSKIMPFVFIGFVIHSFISLRFRQIFLFSLTVTVALYLLGIKQGVFLIGLSLSFIGLYHLPCKLRYRLSLMLLVMMSVATLKVTDWFDITEYQNALTIFGSMFMFRMIVYVYENQVNKKINSTPIMMQLNYFFMLPNLVLPLFPVVDYKLYVNSYLQRHPIEIYEKGLRWITRGFIHLLLYRFIYYYVATSSTNVVDIYTFFTHAVTSYLLILRLSGIFNIAVGILCLFGYDLPEAFNRYFLASSFSDVWRRINIYWKDFILKIFFYPLYFRFRGLKGNKRTLIITFICFMVTWALHSYQWFWLKSELPIRWLDAIFWTFFAVLVTLNTYFQQTAVPSKKQRANTWVLSTASKQVSCIFLVFISMSLLWTLWDSVSLTNWLFMLKRGLNTDLYITLRLLTVTSGLFILGLLVNYLSWLYKNNDRLASLDLGSNAKLRFTILVFIVVIFTQPMKQKVQSITSIALTDFETEHLNSHDINIAVNGYYDELLYKNSINNTTINSPKTWVGLRNTPLIELTQDILLHRLKPNSTDYFKGAQVTINQWAMRDKEYLKTKGDDTIRIALLGSSYDFGSGVDNNSVYENLLEIEINKISRQKIEILNFSVPGYTLLRQVKLMDQKILDFSPDIVILAVHGPENLVLSKKLVKIVKKNIDVEYDILAAHIETSLAAHKDDLSKIDDKTLKQMLAKDIDKLSLWAYKKIADTAFANNIIPVWLHIPVTEEAKRRNFALNHVQTHKIQSHNSGFIQFDLERIFDVFDDESLKIRSWDPLKVLPAFIPLLASRSTRWHPHLGHNISSSPVNSGCCRLTDADLGLIECW